MKKVVLCASSIVADNQTERDLISLERAKQSVDEGNKFVEEHFAFSTHF